MIPPFRLPGSQAFRLLLLPFLLATSGRSAEPASSPLATRSKSETATKLFTDLPAASTGITLINPIDTKHPLKRIYTSGFGGGGLASGDFDGDGRCDLYFVSGARENKLYRNLGNGKFADASAKAGVGGGEAWGAGVAAVDLEGDGDLDLYVCNYGSPNQLFLNDGKGAFTESARSFGLDHAAAFLMAAFADYDLDGDLDVYLLGHRYYRPGGRPNTPVTVVKNGKEQVLPEFEDYYGITQGDKGPEINDVGAPDKLLRNEPGPDGRPRFVEVSTEAGILQERDQGNSVTWWDFNHDGLPDLYVGNDFEHPDLLYRNNGNGTFTDVARQQLPHTSWFTMGVDCGDLNNDGMMDLLVADMAGTTHYKSKTTMGNMGANTRFMLLADPPQYMRNCLYVNTGTGRFMEAAFMSGLANSDWTWAVKMGDLDCDGRLDVFIANGMTRNFNDSDHPLVKEKLHGNTEWDLYENTPARPEKNLAFRNLGDLAFENVSDQWGLGKLGMNYGAAWFDLEGDGDIDLAVTSLDEPPGIFRNDSQEGSRVVLQLRGKGANLAGIGATVKVRTSDGEQIRQFNPMRGFASTDEGTIHFGLGKATKIDSLVVEWPGGASAVYEDLPVNRRYTLKEGEGSPAPAPQPQAPPLFASSDALRGARHWEMPFNDFNLQPLLPNRQSQWGPGLACGDIDGDGDDDFFLGGASGRVGTLMINDGAGRFVRNPFAAGGPHKLSEDLGALFLDSDGDADLDLYVVSGGVEAPPDHESYSDRLYLNDGKGAFSSATFGALPPDPVSNSVVAAADYDRDGDLDLFVGGRFIPGRYPEAPRSQLLENSGGSFTDVTFKSPDLLPPALVTGALWSDADNDGWLDLLVSTEWGPVKFYRNKEGRLADHTAPSGLDGELGWWMGINGGDFDNDGDIDYLATNFGLNTKYKANADEPEILFYGDFEGTGESQIVEAGYEDGVCLPHRGFSCSRNAMPSLGPKLKTFHNFAKSALAEIYPEDKLTGAMRLEANTLASGIFFNDGKANFTFRPLPRLAQIAPSFGSVVCDPNGDGNPDLFLAQNFYGPQIETRPMNEGLGILLEGDGKGGFTPVWPARSGLVIPEDAKSAVPADINMDGLPDLVIGVNDGPVRAFVHRGEGASLAVRLAGKKGNPSGIGARVTMEFANGVTRVAEVTAGGGYLSQAPPVLYFTPPAGATAKKITVRWPDGAETPAEVKAGVRSVVVKPE